MAETLKPATSSRRRISQIVEVNLGVTPATGTWRSLPFMEGAALNQTQTFNRSGEIKSNRQGGRQVGGNIQVGGTLPVPLKYDDAILELLESALSGAFTIPAASGAGGNTSGFAFNHVGVQASGTITLGSNPANGDTVVVNGVTFTFRTIPVNATDVEIGLNAAASAANLRADLAASTNDLVTVATYSVSTNAVTVNFKDVGTEGNSFTLAKTGSAVTVSGATLSGGTAGSDQITRSSGSFLLDGWQAGNAIVVTNATTAGNNIALSDGVTVAAVTATALTLSANARITTDETFGSATVLTTNARFIRSSTARKTFTHEVSYTDMDPVVHEYFRGNEVNTLAINIPTSGEVTGEFAMIGLVGKITEVEYDRSNNMGTGSKTAGTGTRVEPANTVAFAGSVEGTALERGGSSAPDVESLTININNNRAAKFAVGQSAAPFVEEGDFDVEMTFALYFTDMDVKRQYLDGTRTSLKVVMRDQQDGHRMVLVFPNIVFTAGDTGLSGQTVVLNMTAFAEEDPSYGSKALLWIQPAV